MICSVCGYNNRLCTDCDVCAQCQTPLPEHPDDGWTMGPLNCKAPEGNVGHYDSKHIPPNPSGFPR